MANVPEPEVMAPDHDLDRFLDLELGGLPEKYRTAIILCDLEGKTRKEASRQLKIPEGTLSSRLTAGTVMLAKRLARHGLAVTGGALATVLAQNATSACLPPALMAVTARAAILSPTGQAVAAGLISAKVGALTEGTLKAMLIGKLKMVTAATLGLTLLWAGGVACPFRTLAIEPKLAMQVDRPKATRKENKQPSEDKRQLQGTWTLVARETEGNRQEYPQGVGISLKIDGDTLVLWTSSINPLGVNGNGTVSQYKYVEYAAAAAQKPRFLDLVVIDGPKRGQAWARGIYRLRDARLEICWDTGSERPTDFTTKPGSSSVLNIFRRIEPKPQERETEERDKKACQARILRWRILFDTRDGSDYLKQLDALGALVAFPGGDGGKYRVIRDLNKRPAQSTVEDVAKFQRVFWAESDPRTIRLLGKELGLESLPQMIVVILPKYVEDELLRKELAHAQGQKPNAKEDEIEETTFKFVRANSRFEIQVVSQALKK
jgi:uncharacterized protein (TIGR03067 family)